jgi:predicted transcriptional regulator
MSVKEQVLQAIHRFPDDMNYRDAAEEIAFLAAVHEAEREIEEGRLVTNEEMRTRIAESTVS